MFLFSYIWLKQSSGLRLVCGVLCSDRMMVTVDLLRTIHITSSVSADLEDKRGK